MAAETKRSIDDETQIRELIDNLLKEQSEKDVERSVAPYLTEVVSYDLIDPLQYNGVDTIRERLNQWFSSFDGPIDITIRDLHVTAGEDVAFCHGLHHVEGTKKDGGKLEMWWRTTLCMRKLDGRWTITHSHDSVPFDMQTGVASLGLTP